MLERNPLFRMLLVFACSLHGIFAFSQEVTRTIAIKALPGLQFDVVRFHVQPGAQVTLVLTNMDEMDHNLLITKPGAREKIVDAAMQLGGEGPARNYIPQQPEVLWTIPLVSSEQSKSITFIAPEKEGIYPYVCTYPGHGWVMYGAMYVSSSGEMPKLSEDQNIPTKSTTGETHATPDSDADQAHALNPLAPPFLYRVYIDGASPAAIAVRLTDRLSYCWDAGLSKLRFAWKGGFLDNTLLWKGHKNASATILGTVFYRDKVTYPLRINNREAKVEYKGYRLINRYPEFHYVVNGLDVYELILPLETGNGFIRNFRIPKLKETLSFVFDEQDGIDYQVEGGKQRKGRIELRADQGKRFSIIMKEKEGNKE